MSLTKSGLSNSFKFKFSSEGRFYVKKSLCIALVACSLFAGCSKKPESGQPVAQSTPSTEKKIQVGIVFDKAGKDDKSFNTSAYQGGLKAEKELGVTLKTIEPSDDNAYEPALDQFASRNFDIIIAVGFIQEEAVKKVAARYPDHHFAIVDSKVDLPNVASLLFEEHEGSYLVGMLAGMKSKTGTIGFVGGMDIPLIHRFAVAYKAGAQAVNPKIIVKENYAGITVDAFKDPTKGKELANAQIAQNADVIFAAAGITGLGVFDAIEKSGAYGIGVDSNQNWIKPGKILTSMLKRVDVAVFDTIKDVKEEKFHGGVNSFSLQNEGIDYAIDKYNESLITPEMKLRVDQAKQDIIHGKISVPDYYKMKKK